MVSGARLKALRLDSGLTQKELAAPLYTAAYVSTIEAGRRRPSRAALEHFARRLGIDVEELETGVAPGERERLALKIQEARNLIANGNLEEAKGRAAEVESVASDHGWALEAAHGTTVRALAEEHLGEVATACTLYESAQQRLMGISPLLAVDATAGRSRCLQLMGDLRFAIHLLETHLRVLREERLEDPSALARINASLVASYFDAGLLKQAEEAAAIVMDLMPHVSDPDRLANMHLNTARVLLEQGRFEEVRLSLRRAEELYIGLQWRNDLGRVYLARGYTYITEGRFEDAVGDLERSIDIFRSTGNVLNETRSINQLARVLRLTHRTGEAKLLLRGMNADNSGLAEQGIAKRELALCLAQEGNVSEAVAKVNEAIAVFEEAQDIRELAIAYRVLGDLMRDAKEFASACDAYRSAAVALENVA